MKKRFAAGDTLFLEGDPSDVVYLIESGAVAVTKERPDEPVLLGRVEAGEFLGEMGVVEKLPRSASARAETAVEATIFQSVEFMNRVSQDSDLALNLIRRLSMRLRSVDNRIANLEPEPEPAPMPLPKLKSEPGMRVRISDTDRQADKTPSVTIRGGSYALQLYIGADPIAVEKMPYSVGRVGESKRGAIGLEPDLGILDPEPFRLSPMHFMLFEDHDKVFVRDCDSELGTIVNGRSLGRDFPLDQTMLTPGENTVVAGGDGSPYKFLIDV